MNEAGHQPRRGRLPKRTRSDDEIGALAARFGADWMRGDSVQTWINRHEARSRELSGMVRDGWSWADLSRAMFRAGIAYDTGQPIPDYTLRQKAYLARRSRLNGAAADEPPLQLPGQPTLADRPAPAGERTRSAARRSGQPGTAEPEAAVFKIVTTRDGHRPTRGDALKATASVTSPVTAEVTGDDVFRSMFGNTAKR